MSQSFLPVAMPIWTFAYPSLKYSDSGIRVRPEESRARWMRVISLRCSSSLRLRLAEWLRQVPNSYSGMFALISQASPLSSTVAYASDSVARPFRSV